MLALDMLLIVSALENVVEGNAKPSKVKCQSSFMRGLLRSNVSGRVHEFRAVMGGVHKIRVIVMGRIPEIRIFGF